MKYPCLYLLLLITTSYCFYVKQIPHSKSYYSLLEQTTICCKAKSKNQPVSEKVQAYIRMRDLKKLQNDGANIEEMKEFLANGTRPAGLGGESSSKGYQQFVGKKGSLEGRLRAVIAYKRESSIAAQELDGELSKREEKELEEMMDEDDDGYNDDEDGEIIDDEDAEYESLVLKALETNKLNELKRNFLLDKNVRNEDSITSSNETKPKSLLLFSADDDDNNTKSNSDDDLYVPARYVLYVNFIYTMYTLIIKYIKRIFF